LSFHECDGWETLWFESFWWDRGEDSLVFSGCRHRRLLMTIKRNTYQGLSNTVRVEYVNELASCSSLDRRRGFCSKFMNQRGLKSSFHELWRVVVYGYWRWLQEDESNQMVYERNFLLLPRKILSFEIDEKPKLQSMTLFFGFYVN
jgi:hypothetical protein